MTKSRLTRVRCGECAEVFSIQITQIDSDNLSLDCLACGGRIRLAAENGDALIELLWELASIKADKRRGFRSDKAIFDAAVYEKLFTDLRGEIEWAVQIAGSLSRNPPTGFPQPGV